HRRDVRQAPPTPGAHDHRGRGIPDATLGRKGRRVRGGGEPPVHHDAGRQERGGSDGDELDARYLPAGRPHAERVPAADREDHLTVPYAELLNADEIASELAGVPEWSREGEAITRTVRCPSFRAAIALVERVADAAEAADHHPDILI